MSAEIAFLSASEALARFRARTLSPVELLEAQIAEADRSEPVVNALPFRFTEEARAAARKAEARYAKGGRLRPLEGLTVAVKDEGAIAGQPQTNGSRILRDAVADRTSPVNARVLRAGGIVHARTATPEFSCAAYTWSLLHGVTRNPWNPAFTPGGSSGGAGAALAAGMTALATGSDIGGSIRIPASCAGVVGFKPPYGRNPDDPPFNLDAFNHTGPMARSVRDCALLQNVMAGPHPQDIATLRPRLRLPLEYRPIRGWKVAVSPDLGVYEVDPEVAAAFREAVGTFRALGAEVEEIDTGWSRADLEAGMTWLRHIFGAFIGRLLDDHGAEMTPYCRQLAEEGRRSTAAEFVGALEACARMYATLGPVLERHRVLLCPTVALPAVPADFDHSRGEVRINGRPVQPTLGWVMTLPFNMLSRLPVLSLPMGRAGNGVPVGLQIVGRSYRDADVFRAGAAYEQARGPWYADAAHRPPVRP